MMKPVRTAWGIWAAAIPLAIVLVLLAGCAAGSSWICAVAPIGQDESGVAYFRYACRPE